MTTLKEQIRDGFDLVEYLSRLSYLELTELTIQFAECLYGQGALYVKYEVPEDYRGDPEEPESFYLRWVSTNEDVLESVML